MCEICSVGKAINIVASELVAVGGSGVKVEDGVTANGCRVSFWSNKYILALDYGDGHETLNRLKSIELFTLNG